MPPVTPRTIRLPASIGREPARRGRLRSPVGVGRPSASAASALVGSAASTATILSAAISSKAIDSGLRATEVTCGGTIVPRPSPSWPKYELIWRARLAPSVTSRNFESARVEQVLDRRVHHRVVLPGHAASSRTSCRRGRSRVPARPLSTRPPRRRAVRRSTASRRARPARRAGGRGVDRPGRRSHRSSRSMP